MRPEDIKTSDDFDPDAKPFAEFRDWCTMQGVDDEWAEVDKEKEWRTPKQIEIVNANREALRDKAKLQARFDALEQALSKIRDDDVRSEIREYFGFRLVGYVEEDEAIDLAGMNAPCLLDMDGSEFQEGINADSISVSGAVWLDSAKVTGNVRLNSAKVTGDVSLHSATVNGNVLFYRAKVTGGVWLLAMKLSETSSMPASGMEVEGSLYVRSKFHGAVNFSRLKVQGTASFSGSVFHEVPNFRDAVFERPPEVAGMVLPEPVENYLPAKLRDHHGFWLQTAADEEDAAKYRKLKAMAQSANDHEKDIEFFAYEMQAKRGVEKGSSTTGELLFNSAYYWLSYYGWSVYRPLVWLGGSLLAFMAVYTAFAVQVYNQKNALWFGFVHSVVHLLPLTTSVARFGGGPEGYRTNYEGLFRCLPKNLEYKNIVDCNEILGGRSGLGSVSMDALLLAGYVQQFIGIILLFLLLLALRNKFRLK